MSSELIVPYEPGYGVSAEREKGVWSASHERKRMG